MTFSTSSTSTKSILLICVSAIAVLFQGSNALSSNPGKKKYYGGAGVGRLTFDSEAAIADAWKCKYDMVLVERIQGKPEQESGLFIPDDDLPKLHLCQVLSMGPGREEENGNIAVIANNNIKLGSFVVAKNPWGIGPKDEETSDGKKLSYMRIQDIAAVLDGSFVDEGTD